MKTRDAFALRGFDEKRILQRPWFRGLKLFDGQSLFGWDVSDSAIRKAFFANAGEGTTVIEKLVKCERLNERAKKYHAHLNAHVARVRKIMHMYSERYTISDDEQFQKKYFRAAKLFEFYSQLCHSVYVEFYGEVVYPMLVIGLDRFLRGCRKQFATRLRQARTTQKLTQQQLAERVGLKSFNAIAQYERGLAEPSLPTLIRLTYALNCSTDWLIGKTDSP